MPFGELKTVKEILNIARFVAMFDARMCCFFSIMWGNVLFGFLQPNSFSLTT